MKLRAHLAFWFFVFLVLVLVVGVVSEVWRGATHTRRMIDERDRLVVECDSLKLLVVALNAKSEFDEFVMRRMLAHFQMQLLTTTAYSKYKDDGTIRRYDPASPRGWDGHEVMPDFTVAVDPRRFPMGTMFYRVQDGKWFVAGDKLDDPMIAKTGGMCIDICVDKDWNANHFESGREWWKAVTP